MQDLDAGIDIDALAPTRGRIITRRRVAGSGHTAGRSVKVTSGDRPQKAISPVSTITAPPLGTLMVAIRSASTVSV